MNIHRSADRLGATVVGRVPVGYKDILVGLGNDGVGTHGATSGSVYLVYGAAAATLPGFFDNGAGGVYFTRFDGAASGDMAGLGVLATDLDHDGTADIIIAAPYADPGAVSNAGSIYVLWGKSDWKGTTTYDLNNIQ